MGKIRKILSTFRKSRLFMSDGSLVHDEKVKASRTASQRQETFAHQLERGPPRQVQDVSPARAAGMGGGSGRVDKMTKWELLVIVTLLTLSVAVLLFLSS